MSSVACSQPASSGADVARQAGPFRRLGNQRTLDTHTHTHTLADLRQVTQTRIHTHARALSTTRSNTHTHTHNPNRRPTQLHTQTYTHIRVIDLFARISGREGGLACWSTRPHDTNANNLTRPQQRQPIPWLAYTSCLPDEQSNNQRDKQSYGPQVCRITDSIEKGFDGSCSATINSRRATTNQQQTSVPQLLS